MIVFAALLLIAAGTAPAVCADPVQKPAFTARPTPEEFAAALTMSELPLDTRISIACQVGPSLDLRQCRPEGKVEDQRVSAAMLSLTPKFRLAATDLDGRPVAGRCVVLRFRFDMTS